jgi:hypothetical protein
MILKTPCPKLMKSFPTTYKFWLIDFDQWNLNMERKGFGQKFVPKMWHLVNKSNSPLRTCMNIIVSIVFMCDQ